MALRRWFGTLLFWVGLAPSLAGAAVDLNGHFIAEILFPGGSCNFDVTQVGTAITLDGDCPPFSATGTIDTNTGVFSATAPPGLACGAPDGLHLNGTGAQDSYSFTVTVSCFGQPAFVFASRCGNGVLDAGEAQACDDAAATDSAACCTDHCQLRPSGAPCNSGGPLGQCNVPDACDGSSATCPDLTSPDGTPCNDQNACTTTDACSAGTCVGSAPAPPGTDCLNTPDPCIDGQCDALGVCQPFFTTAPCNDNDACTTADTCDGNGTCVGGPPLVCGPCEVCSNVGGCFGLMRYDCTRTGSRKSMVSLRDVSPDDNDRLGWKWLKGPAIDPTEFDDPVSTTDYELCVFHIPQETLPPQLLLGATAPAGAGWEATSTGFRYRNPSLAPDGLRSIVLKAGDAGMARLIVKGRGPNLGLPPTLDDVGTPVTVQLRAEDGACWDAEYPTASVHTSTVFKARAASPGGAFVGE